MSRPEDTDAFSAYAEDAQYYELPEEDLDRSLPAFSRGLLTAAGRMLATLAYRDAATYGDRPFDRSAPQATGTVLHLAPEACDTRDRAFRAGAARAFHDLAEDLDAGKAPLPRCAAEDWALAQMLTLASRACAATDGELRALGVPLPEERKEGSYRPPYWEDAWQFIIEGAKYSIPEAQPADTGEDAEDIEDETVPEPEGGWDGPDYWFSPYSITAPRDPHRGHPAWAQAHLDGAPLVPAGPLSAERSAELLRLGSRTTAWDAYEGQAEYEELAEVLTPQAAQVLAVAAGIVAERGYHDLLHYGDRVFDRPSEEDEWRLHDSFLLELPPICDGQGASWRLAMVRALDDLADDLRADRAPLPRCTAEELAFHLMLREAEVLFDFLDDDEDFAEGYGLPPAEEFTARHRQFGLWREAFLQDEDVLFHYDEGLAHVAADPDHPASQQLGTGDLRPNAWFVTFGNLRSRDAARGFNPDVLDQLRTADPDAFFASTPALTATVPESPSTAPDLRDEFETFIGYAQRRFFDEPTAVAMAASLDRLLTLLLATPVLGVDVWPRHDRAQAEQAGPLLVDRDFCLAGRTHVWRLHADQNERHARTWALKLLDDCSAYALRALAAPVPSYLAHREPARPAPDPQLPGKITARLNELAEPDTARGTLRHQLAAHKMTCADLADAAILPETLVAAWLDGTGTISPAQLVRCAPVLQMPEDVLLACLGGGRDRYYWPLPQADPDQIATGT
ncbi:hypothetical protein ACF1A9_27725 [Streptomyces sp. NPDC014872]|uniref:hypothetical protein n=1 Tax=Streptomyces sp. NPDC014872 TaxID=3364926 RepID=UPI0036FC098F